MRSSASDCRASRPRPRYCSTSRPRPAPSSSSTSSGAGPAWGRPSFSVRSTRRSAAGSSRSCRNADWPIDSRTSWSGGRSTIGSQGSAERSSTCASGSPSKRPEDDRSARSLTLRIISPPPRRLAKRDVRSSTTSVPRVLRSRRSPSTRRRTSSVPRSSWGSTSRRERAEVLIELGAARHRAGRALDALDALRLAPRIWRVSWGAPSSSHGRRSATRLRPGR